MSLVVIVCGCHGYGRHGHCLWSSQFVAAIVEPRVDVSHDVSK